MADILSQEEIDALLEVVDEMAIRVILRSKRDRRANKSRSLFMILSAQTVLVKSNFVR